MFERFTDRARRVLVLAQEESRLLGHTFIGTEHLLLGLLHEDTGLAGQALRALGVQLIPTRERVDEMIGPSGAATAGTGSPPFTPRAKKVLELSLRESLLLHHHHIGTEHLLLGLVREGEGVGAQVLVASGHPLSDVRAAVTSALEDAGDEVQTAGSSPATQRTVTSQVTSTIKEEPPRCPSCGTGLAGGLAYVVLTAEPGEGEQRTDAVEVLLGYCGRCGTALTSTPVTK